MWRGWVRGRLQFHGCHHPCCEFSGNPIWQRRSKLFPFPTNHEKWKPASERATDWLSNPISTRRLFSWILNSSLLCLCLESPTEERRNRRQRKKRKIQLRNFQKRKKWRDSRRDSEFGENSNGEVWESQIVLRDHLQSSNALRSKPTRARQSRNKRAEPKSTFM